MYHAETQHQIQLETDIQRLLEPLPCTSISRSSSSFEMSALLACKIDKHNQLDLQQCTCCQEHTLGKMLHVAGRCILLQRQDCNLWQTHTQARKSCTHWARCYQWLQDLMHTHMQESFACIGQMIDGGGCETSCNLLQNQGRSLWQPCTGKKAKHTIPLQRQACAGQWWDTALLPHCSGGWCTGLGWTAPGGVLWTHPPLPASIVGVTVDNSDDTNINSNNNDDDNSNDNNDDVNNINVFQLIKS